MRDGRDIAERGLGSRQLCIDGERSTCPNQDCQAGACLGPLSCKTMPRATVIWRDRRTTASNGRAAGRGCYGFPAPPDAPKTWPAT